MIHADAVLGDDVTIWQHVTIGGGVAAYRVLATALRLALAQ